MVLVDRGHKDNMCTCDVATINLPDLGSLLSSDDFGTLAFKQPRTGTGLRFPCFEEERKVGSQIVYEFLIALQEKQPPPSQDSLAPPTPTNLTSFQTTPPPTPPTPSVTPSPPSTPLPVATLDPIPSTPPPSPSLIPASVTTLTQSSVQARTLTKSPAPVTQICCSTAVIPSYLEKEDSQIPDVSKFLTITEGFKQRRIKLGYTQADVGKELGHLSLPGVGPLSQSTICRFESLTLSHNNMMALIPTLQAWMESAENSAACRKKSIVDGKSKRNRTAIAMAEKRVLENNFEAEPRPTRKQMTDLAKRLDLDKKVVRVWYCNRRQKQKQIKKVGVQFS